MRNLKKVLSLALALVMLVGMMVVGAGATSFADDASIQNQEAVSVLAGLGVVKGREDGSNFDPTGTLTRAEAAMMIAQLDLGVDAAAALKANGTNPFSDVAASHWAAGAIDYCVEQGYIRGDGNGHFFPGNNVTGVEFGIMLSSLLGYDAKAEGVTGSEWQTKGAALARRAGLTSGVAANTADMTRDGMAQMAFNALKADMVEYVDGTGTIIDLGGIGTITTGAKATKVPGTGDGTNKDYRVGTADDDVQQLCERTFPGLRVTTEDDAFGIPTVQWYVGKKADSAYNADDVIAQGEKSGIVATYTDNVGSVTKAQLAKIGVTATSGDSGGAPKVFENGAPNSTLGMGSADTDKLLAAYKGATVHIVKDSNDKMEVRVVYGYLAQVTKVTDATETKDRTINLKVYKTAGGTNITGYATEAFEKDQWVMVYPNVAIAGAVNNKDAIADIKPVDSIIGTVSKVAGTNNSAVTAVTVDGNKYSIAADSLAQMGLGGKIASASNYSFEDDYTLFLSNGYVVGVSGEVAALSVDDVVYVTRNSWTATNSYGQDRYYVETVKMDGTTEIIETGTNPSITGIAGDPKVGRFYKVNTVSGNKTFTLLTTTVNASTFGFAALNGNQDMTDKTNSLNVTTIGRAYMSDSTRLLFVTGEAADLKVTMETGAMKQSLTAAKTLALVSQDASGNKIIEALVILDSKVDVGGEVVYITGSKTGADSIGDLYTMYTTEGEKSEVPTKAGSGSGFATFTTDDKGAYSFKPVGTASGSNKDGVYKSLATAAMSVYSTRNLISVDCGGGNTLVDMDASNAAIIDLSDDEVGGLTDLNGKYVTADILVRDGAVVTIVVKDVADGAHSHTYTASYQVGDTEHTGVCACGAVAATGTPHAYTDSYQVFEDDATKHIGVCVCGKVDPTDADAAVHTFANDEANGNHKCSDCGATGDHDYTGVAWSKDATQHWHVCKADGCDKTDTKTDHTVTYTQDAAGKQHTPKCNVCNWQGTPGACSKGPDNHCTVCGRDMTSD